MLSQDLVVYACGGAGNFRYVTDDIVLSAEKLEQAETDGAFNLGAEEGPPIRNLARMIVDLSGEMCPENTPASSPAYN